MRRELGQCRKDEQECWMGKLMDEKVNKTTQGGKVMERQKTNKNKQTKRTTSRKKRQMVRKTKLIFHCLNQCL